MKRVVIIGGGFAGLAAAQRLERERDIDVTIVNRTNYTLFTPMLPEVASGAIEPRHIAQPLRTSLRRARFEEGTVTGVDFAARTVALDNALTERATTLTYDALVLAVGATNSTHGVAGANDHTFPLKTLSDAIRLREQTIRMLETADIEDDADERRRCLTFVVVGGGFTGVEAVGELRGYLRDVQRFYSRVTCDDIRVVLVSGSNRLLEQLPQRFGERAKRMLAERGVALSLGDEAATIDANGISLKSGTRHESRTVIWSAGVRPAPLIEHIDIPKSPHQAVLVNPDFSVPNRPGVWAAGDCAQILKPDGHPYAQTAQDAVREGPALAANLVASLRGRPTRPFRYRSPGMMASLGNREGLADLGGLMLTGIPAWVLWRLYYLAQLPGLERKTRVTIDWMLALPFRGDVAIIS